MKEKIGNLLNEFSAWPAALEHGLHPTSLKKGKAEAVLTITSLILTPHPIPMVNGLLIEAMATMTGVYAVRTLIDDEYPVFKKTVFQKFMKPTILEEKELLIRSKVINDRLARKDIVIVAADVEGPKRRTKARFIFQYQIIHRGVMENRLRNLVF